MTKRLYILLFTASLAYSSATSLFAEGASSLGLGASYFTAIDNLSSEVDENGFSYFVSYQYRPGFIGIEANFEVLPDVFGVDAIAPSAYVVIGQTLYVAAGIGMIRYDGEWADDPFYGLKLGLNLNLTENIVIDVFGNYQVSSSVDLGDAVDEIDTDTVFLGAAVRFGF